MTHPFTFSVYPSGFLSLERGILKIPIGTLSGLPYIKASSSRLRENGRQVTSTLLPTG